MKKTWKSLCAFAAAFSVLLSSLPADAAMLAAAEESASAGTEESTGPDILPASEVQSPETVDAPAAQAETPLEETTEDTGIVEGTWGENIRYTLNKETGELIVSGSGDMEESSNYYAQMPFYAYKDIITSAVFEEGITAVCNYALLDCEKLTSVSLPDSLRRIGYSAFDGCSALTDVTLPASLEILEYSAFEGCTSLTSVDFPDSLKEMGKMAFYGCTSLVSVTLPEGLTAIPERAFYGCSSLETVHMPSVVEKIGNSAFMYCSALPISAIPASVSVIEEQAFYGCIAIQTLTIPGSTAEIGDRAFYSCDGLTSLTLEEGVTSVGESAFAYCEALTEVSLPKSLTSIGSGAFSNTPYMEAQTDAFQVLENGMLYAYQGTDTDIVLPDSVTAIADGVFQGHAELATVVLPEGLTEIGSKCFYGCTSLQSVKLPDSLEKIGDECFSGCSSLISADLPEGLAGIGSQAFYNCTALAELNVPDSISQIGLYAFENTPFLDSITEDMVIFGTILYRYQGNAASVTVPDGITAVLDEAFIFRLELEEVILPDTLQTIGENAFVGCHSMTDLIIPESVVSIGSHAVGYYCDNGFSGSFEKMSAMSICGKSGSAAETYAQENELNFLPLDPSDNACGADLTWSVDLQTGTLTIRGTGDMTDFSYPGSSSEGAVTSPFYLYRNMITSVVIEEGVTSVGSYAFRSFENLRSLQLPSTLKEIHDDAFSYCRKLETLPLPEGLESIGEDAFYACSALKSLTIPDGCHTLPYNVFADCQSLTSVVLPASLMELSSYAFRYCDALQSVTIDESNEIYVTEDGILYSAGKRSIELYPVNHPAVQYTIPSTVTSMPYALRGAKNLRCLTVPASVVSSSSSSVFSDCTSLERIIFLGNAPKLSSYYEEGDYPDYQFSNAVTVSCSFSAEGWTECMAASTASQIRWEDLDETAAVNSLRILDVPETVQTGSKVQLQAQLNPLLCTVFNWSSSDPDVAVISDRGMVTAVGAGTAVITCISEDGIYKAKAELTVADGEGSGFVLPAYDSMELDADVVGTPFRSMQFPCQALNGIYFLNNEKLSFYSFQSHSAETVRNFSYIIDAYEQDGLLYVLTDSNVCEVFSLEEQRTVSRISVPAGYSGKAAGADAQGRIYIAAANSSNSADRRIFLMSPQGEVLSSASSPTTVYHFSGFDSQTGKFFMESYYNFYSWGYDHPGRGLTMGCVSDDQIYCVSTSSSMLESGIITRDFDCIEYLCQDVYLNHQESAALLGSRYLVSRSPMTSRFTVRDTSTNGLDTIMTLDREVTEYELSNDYTDPVSVGTRAVYNEARGSIIMYDNNKTLTEYLPETGEVISSREVKEYVYSLHKMGNYIIAVERSQDGVYSMELIEWKAPDSITISAETEEMSAGSSQQLSVTADSQLSSSFIWSSSDSQILSVSQTGKVTAWKQGEAVVSCTSPDGSLTAQITITVLPGQSPAVKTAIRADGIITDNISLNNYTVWDRIVSSYLTETADGDLLRVEALDDSVLTELHKKDGTLVSSAYIENELPIFGGFFSSKDAYYLVFGQENAEESDSCEIMRIVKYTTDWERLDSCSVYGANTSIPFDAGTLSMEEASGKLYIHTCHQMYESSDGLHHQANMTYVLNMESMEMEQSYYDVLNVMQAGYVSHSFSQFVRADDTYVYRVDHGDAGPRAIALTRCEQGDSITNVRYTNAYDINGGYGVNSTGVSVGGMELSDQNCLIAINSVDMEAEAYSASGIRNILLLAVRKDGTGKAQIPLTNYSEEDGVTVRTPHLVKLSNDAFLLMWEEASADGSVLTKLVTCSGEGVLTSEVQTAALRLSDCQPVLTSDGLVRWYTTNDHNLTFYAVDPFDLSSIQGSEIQYSFDETTGTLTIRGTGAMADYESSAETPWAEYLSQAEKLVIEDGVTSVGANAFADAAGLTSVQLPDSLEEIGETAFSGCIRLTEIRIPDGTEKIGDYALGYVKAGGMKPLVSFTIVGSTGTAADLYASENSMHFRALDVVYGDVDHDGETELRDIVMLNRYLMEYDDQQLDSYGMRAADCYMDLELDGKDSVTILKYLIGLEDSLPVDGSTF